MSIYNVRTQILDDHNQLTTSSQHKHLQPTGANTQPPSQAQTASHARLNDAFDTIRQEFDVLAQEINVLRGQRDEFENKGTPSSSLYFPSPHLTLIRQRSPQSQAKSTNSTSSVNPSTNSKPSMERFASSTKKRLGLCVKITTTYVNNNKMVLQAQVFLPLPPEKVSHH